MASLNAVTAASYSFFSIHALPFWQASAAASALAATLGSNKIPTNTVAQNLHVFTAFPPVGRIPGRPTHDTLSDPPPPAGTAVAQARPTGSICKAPRGYPLPTLFRYGPLPPPAMPHGRIC